MSDFYIDIEIAHEALVIGDLKPLRQLFANWNLDINNAQDWQHVEDSINSYLEAK